MRRHGFAFVVFAVLTGAAFAACDETLAIVPAPPTTDASADGSTTDATKPTDGTAPGDAAQDSAVPDAGSLAARGKYIVDHLAACGDCHTPRKQDGSFDMTRYLAGIDCFVGVDQTPPDGGADAGDAGDASADAGQGPPGCLNSRNLTNHATGLMNRSDAEIKQMLQQGTRPNGQALHPFMPYWLFANLTTEDANAIVAYLRTVPGVDHAVAPNQPPWSLVTQPAPPLNLSTVPMPSADAGESAMRGRYLASVAAGCIDCHTPETAPGSGILDSTKWFAGNKAFPAALIGLPAPPFPAVIYTANLTTHATGLAGHTAQDIVNVIKQGKDRDGGGVCPPMPVGPMGPFGGMTDADALDIANYLLTLPPIDNARVANCIAP